MSGIPYMGNKGKLAKGIIDTIIERHPQCKNFYDLFGGGASISLEAVKRDNFDFVFYNEIDSGVVALLEDILANGVCDRHYQWISRENFHALKGGDTWLSGLVKTCWSFGNDGSSYLYSKENEYKKKYLHDLIVNPSDKHAKGVYDIFGIDIPNSVWACIDGDTIRARRLRIMKYLKGFIGVYRVENLERIDRLPKTKNNTSKLSVSNLSYDQVDIVGDTSNTVIYLDPPYENTEQYQNKIDHKKLLDWILTSKYPIYVSGYDMNLPVAKEWDGFRCTLSSTNNSKVVTEKLFYNGK